MAVALGCGEHAPPTPPCDGAECEEGIDECTTDNGGCDPVTECTNTIETRICGACPIGYSGTGETACVDIDECATANGGCDALVTCSNTAGARTCGTCPTGYSGTGDAGCVDIDECSTANGSCDALTTCANTPGGRTCSACPSGFTGTGDTACVDIDECLVDHGNCDPLASCTNTPGGRTCGACPTTHAGTGETGCIEPISCADDDLDALVAAASHEVPVSAECGGNPTRCCNNGVPSSCGSLAYDYTLEPGDPPRYTTSAVQDGFDATLRVRVKATEAIPLDFSQIGECALRIDTQLGATQEIQLTMGVRKVSGANGPHLTFGNFSLSGFTSSDFSISGGALCSVVSVPPSVIADMVLENFHAGIVDRVCTTCPCE